MSNPIVSKTFNERVQPDLYNDFKENRDALVRSTMGKLDAVREQHQALVADTLPSLAALQVQALETCAFIDAFGVGLKRFRDFTFEQAISYTPPLTVPHTEASAVQLCSRASGWVQGRLATFSRSPLSLPERFKRTGDLKADFGRHKEGITSDMFKMARERGAALATVIETVCQETRDFPHGQPAAVRSLGAIARALRSFSQDELLATEIVCCELGGDGVSQKITLAQMFKAIERSISQLATGIIDGADARPLATEEIRKQHARAANELKVPTQVALSKEEKLILKYFSLMESLSNPRLEEGARRRYSVMRDEIVPELQAMNRRDRAHSVKSLQRLGKTAGWEIIPQAVDDAYWAKIGGDARTDVAAVDPAGAPVHLALKPYVQDAGRKVAGVRVKELEREIKIGTVEGTVKALSAVVTESQVDTSILAANPKLFLDFQKSENGSFRQYVETLRGALPTIAAIRARGGEISATQISTTEGVRVMVDAENRRTDFHKAKAEALGILGSLGFSEPETALAVLRRGTLVKGTYQTVSERTFDDFAKKGVVPADEIKVPALRDQLVRTGLLSKRADGALSLAVRADGKRGVLVSWVRAHHPGADIA